MNLLQKLIPNNVTRRDAVRGPPSRSQATELVSGLARVVRDGFDNDVTNYLLATVSGYELVVNGADEPVPEVDGCDSEPTQKKSECPLDRLFLGYPKWRTSCPSADSTEPL